MKVGTIGWIIKHHNGAHPAIIALDESPHVSRLKRSMILPELFRGSRGHRKQHFPGSLSRVQRPGRGMHRDQWGVERLSENQDCRKEMFDSPCGEMVTSGWNSLCITLPFAAGSTAVRLNVLDAKCPPTPAISLRRRAALISGPR
jgi:hypothetical protein